MLSLSGMMVIEFYYEIQVLANITKDSSGGGTITKKRSYRLDNG